MLYGWNLALPPCELHLMSSVLSLPPEIAASERAEIILIAMDVASSTPLGGVVCAPDGGISQAQCPTNQRRCVNMDIYTQIEGKLNEMTQRMTKEAR